MTFQRHDDAPSGIRRAVTLAGSQERLAKQLGVSKQAIQKWLKKGFVPVGRVVEIETEYGVPRRELLAPKLADLVDAGLGADK